MDPGWVGPSISASIHGVLDPDTYSRRRFLASIGIAATSLPGIASGTRTGKYGVSEDGEGTHTSTENGGGWRMYQRDSANSGYKPGAAGPGSNREQSWSVSWEGTTERRSRLAVDEEGRLYVAGYVAKEDAATERLPYLLTVLRIDGGERDWQVSLEVGIPKNPLTDVAIANGTVCVSYAAGDGLADGPSSGSSAVFDVPARERLDDGPGGGTIAVQDGRFIVPTWSETAGMTFTEATRGVAAIDADTGSTEWNRTLVEYDYSEEENPLASTIPVAMDGTIYTSGPEGMISVDVDTGDVTQFSDVDGYRVLDEQRSLVHTISDDRVYSLELATGEAVGEPLATDVVPRSMALAGDRIYVVTEDDRLVSYRLDDRRREWSYGMSGEIAAPPVIGGSVAYLATGDIVHAVNRHTGAAMPESPFAPFHVDPGARTAPFDQPPVVANGTLFLATEAGNYYGLTDGFAPRVDAFGFDNWSGDACWEGDRCHDHSAVSQAEIQRIVEEYWPPDIGNEYVASVVEFVYTDLNSGSATNGHCYGMVFAAAEYCNDPAALPSGAENNREVPHPAGAYDTVGDTIDFHQSTQKLDGTITQSAYEEIWNGFRLLVPAALIDEQEERAELVAALDRDGTVPISLGKSGRGMLHKVLGYRYEERPDGLRVYVYDPTRDAGTYREGDPTDYRLEISEDGSIEYYVDGGFVSKYDAYVVDVDIDRDLSRGDFLINLFVQLLQHYIVSATSVERAAGDRGSETVGAGWPAGQSQTQSEAKRQSDPTLTIEVTTPDGRTYSSIHADNADFGAIEYDDYVPVPATADGDHEITIRSEVAGEFEIRTRGGSDEVGVIDSSTRVTVSADQPARLQTNLSSADGESGELAVVEEADIDPGEPSGESPDGDGTGSGGEADGADGPDADDDGPGLGVLAALSGLGGLTYRYLQRRREVSGESN